MNKKIVASSIVASSLAIALMVTPKIHQSSTSINLQSDKALSSSVYRVDGKTISIILSSSNSALTKKDLTNLLLKYYNTEVSKVYKLNGEEVLKDSDIIGTGYVVELSSGCKDEVVIYGDVNGDGLVNTTDTITVAKYNVDNNSLKDKAKLKAANLTFKKQGSSKIDTSDTVRIAYYNVGLTNNEIVDSELYLSDDNNIVFDLNKIDVKNLRIEKPKIQNEGNKQSILPEVQSESNEQSDVPEVQSESNEPLDVLEVQSESSEQPDVPEVQNQNNEPSEVPEVQSQNNEPSDVPETEESLADNPVNDTSDEEETQSQVTAPGIAQQPEEEDIPEVQPVFPEQPSAGEQTVDKQNHVCSFSDWTVTTPATCVSNGEQTRSCTICGKTETQTISNPHGHELEEAENIAPTCETYGKVNHKKCKLCNAEFFDIARALGHEYSNEYTVDKEATCTLTGTESRHCVHDGCSSKIDTKTISAKGHNLITEVQSATCTTAEITTKKCSDCNYSVSEKTADAKGHSFSTYTSNNDATCTHDGTLTAKCDNCAEISTKADVGSKLQHNYVSKCDEVAPTCTTSGHEANKVCSICGDVKEGAKLYALGHSFDFATMNINDDSDEIEADEVTCTRCKCTIDFANNTFGKGHTWNNDHTACTCGDENCKFVEGDSGKYTGPNVWWKEWAKGGTHRASCIWWVGFTCDLSQCVGFKESLSGQIKSTIYEGRRGTVPTIEMVAPEAREGYEFDGWYQVTSANDTQGTKINPYTEKAIKEDESGLKTYTKDEESDGKTIHKIIVGWVDMDKGFQARYTKKAETHEESQPMQKFYFDDCEQEVLDLDGVAPFTSDTSDSSCKVQDHQQMIKDFNGHCTDMTSCPTNREIRVKFKGCNGIVSQAKFKCKFPIFDGRTEVTDTYRGTVEVSHTAPEDYTVNGIKYVFQKWEQKDNENIADNSFADVYEAVYTTSSSEVPAESVASKLLLSAPSYGLSLSMEEAKKLAHDNCKGEPEDGQWTKADPCLKSQELTIRFDECHHYVYFVYLKCDLTACDGFDGSAVKELARRGETEEKVTAPQAKPGYQFKGWKKETKEVTLEGEKGKFTYDVYTALYEKIAEKQ